MYNAYLVQVNAATNTNKFYSVQLLQISGEYMVHTWRGGIGDASAEPVGNWSKNCGLYPKPTLSAAIAEFQKWYTEHTGQRFGNRHNFKQLPGKYNYIPNPDLLFGQAP